MMSERLNQIKKNDIPTPESLVREFGNRLFRSALFLSDSRDDAEDIVQETFARVFASIHRFEGRSSLFTWVYRIFLNTTHDLRRKKFLQEKFLNKFKTEEPANPVPDPLDQLDNEMSGRSLHEALKSLKMKHREVIVLRFFEDLKLKGIAERLNINTGTVKSRLHHALNKLKKSIKNIEPFLEIKDQRYGGNDGLH
jgi:RNA polymerase sigma-70 factor (ECF subfamily)